MSAPANTSRTRAALLAAAILAAGATGCQQDMAQQPYYKPYESTTSFPDGRSARPLERGVVHRNQAAENDPLVTGLTAEEWGRVWKKADTVAKVDLNRPTPIENREEALGAPRVDPRVGGAPAVYVNEFPFEMTEADLRRGQERFTIYCAVCHGTLGNGKGKIWERGFLKPTSFHTAKVDDAEPVEVRDGVVYDSPGVETKLGYSRGYGRWRIDIPLREVPVGYIFEVITRGYGGMPDYSAQLSPADRWRVVAYVRTLQYTQHADAGAGGKK